MTLWILRIFLLVTTIVFAVFAHEAMLAHDRRAWMWLAVAGGFGVALAATVHSVAAVLAGILVVAACIVSRDAEEDVTLDDTLPRRR